MRLVELSDAIWLAIAPVHGGLFAWVRFVDGTDADDLFVRAVDRGVAFVPGSSFTLDGGQRDALRLCFASLPPERLVDAVDRLAAAAIPASSGGVCSTPWRTRNTLSPVHSATSPL